MENPASATDLSVVLSVTFRYYHANKIKRKSISDSAR